MALHSAIVAPIISKALFQDMLAEETNFTPSCHSRHVKFTNTVEGGLTSTLCKLQEEVALPAKPTFQSHPEEIGLYMATCEFQKMCEPKISKLKGGYTSSAGLVFQSWLMDICVHVQD